MKTERKYKENGDYVEVSNSQQNSIEVGQTSKGEWYIKSVKVYGDDELGMEAKLKAYLEIASEMIGGK